MHALVNSKVTVRVFGSSQDYHGFLRKMPQHPEAFAIETARGSVYFLSSHAMVVSA